MVNDIGLNLDGGITEQDLFYYQMNAEIKLTAFERRVIKLSSQKYSSSFHKYNLKICPPPIHVEHTDEDMNIISDELIRRRKNNG